MKKILNIYSSKNDINIRQIVAYKDNILERKNKIVVAITAYFKPMVFDRVEYIEKNIVKALANN